MLGVTVPVTMHTPVPEMLTKLGELTYHTSTVLNLWNGKQY